MVAQTMKPHQPLTSFSVGTDRQITGKDHFHNSNPFMLKQGLETL